VKLLKNKNLYAKLILQLLTFLIIFAQICLAAADDIERIKKDLNSSDWKIRLKAVENLSSKRNEDAVNLLMEVAVKRGENWPVKKKAILTLGEIKDPKAIEILLSIFNDPFLNWECPALKSYTALALGNFKGDARVVDALIKGMKDRELLTREASIRSLGKIGDSRAVPHIINLLGDKSAAIKLSAIKALEEIGDDQAISHLQYLAENDNDSLIKREANASLNNFRKHKDYR
jgi:HEAT repeat protein